MLTTLTTALTAIAGALNLVNKTNEDVDKFINDNKKMKALSANGNMLDITNQFVIEPVIVATKKASNSKVYNAIEIKNVDLFTAFYTRTFEVLNKIHNIDAETTFSLLSSKRHSGTLDALGTLGRITKESDSFTVEHKMEPTTEASKDNGANTLVREVTMDVATNKDNLGGYSMKILIIAVNKVVDFGQITGLLSNKIVKGSLAYWYHEWRSGGTSLINLIVGKDMIKEYKRNKFSENDNLESEIEKRVTAANKQLMYDGAVGFSKYYQMVIITAEEEAKLEKVLGLRLNRDSDRALEELKSLAITVLDEDYELATTYISGVSGAIKTSYKNLVKKQDSELNMADLAKIMSTRTI